MIGGVNTYLFLVFGSLLFPLLLSFDKKVHFYTYWWRLFPSILIGAVVFIVWDAWFTELGIWQFNADFIIGTWFFGLPLEEILFFLFIPYACMFIYECLRAYFSDVLMSLSKAITFILLFYFATMAVVFSQELYTVITFWACFAILLLHFVFFRVQFLGYFYLMWLIHLIPLFIINGFLTSLPVVIYNNDENMQFRVGSVPFEDMFYSFAMLLLITTIYEGIGKIKKGLKN